MIFISPSKWYIISIFCLSMFNQLNFSVLITPIPKTKQEIMDLVFSDENRQLGSMIFLIYFLFFFKYSNHPWFKIYFERFIFWIKNLF